MRRRDKKSWLSHYHQSLFDLSSFKANNAPFEAKAVCVAKGAVDEVRTALSEVWAM